MAFAVDYAELAAAGKSVTRVTVGIAAGSGLGERPAIESASLHAAWPSAVTVAYYLAVHSPIAYPETASGYACCADA